jgi:regulator of protease activity HflC (stomatin/prohibitin superfamily)
MLLPSRAAASALLPLLSSSSSSLASSSSSSALSFAAALSSRAAPRLRAAQALQLRRSSSSSSRYGGGARDSRLPLNLGFVIVPQQRAYVVERLGRFSQTLPAGLAFLIPFVDRVAYVHSLKEEAIAIQSQTAITRDNVTITIDGVLYVRITDPYAASYGVSDPFYALTQLAQTAMRSELGQITLDDCFKEREALNAKIVATINQAARAWGTECLRYELRDIAPPTTVKIAMDSQAEAERKKRVNVLNSEGEREAEVNRAEGLRRSIVLQAQGEAESTLVRARAAASAVELLAKASQRAGGREAIAMRVAEQYVGAFGRLAKRSNTLVVPANVGDVSGMVAQGLSIFGAIADRRGGGGGGGGGFAAGDDATAAEDEKDAAEDLSVDGADVERGAGGAALARRESAAAAAAAQQPFVPQPFDKVS